MYAYLNLSPEWRGELDEYLATMTQTASRSNQAFCSKFLFLMQQNGLQAISEIRISDIVSATQTVMKCKNKHTRESLLSSAKRFFLFENEKGNVFDCLPLMLKYYPRNQVLFLSEFSDEMNTAIMGYQCNPEMSAEEFHKYSNRICHTMEEMDYCHLHIVNIRKLADLHYLFLSSESLSYNKETYVIWRDVFLAKVMHGPSVRQDINRLLGFINQMQSFDKIIPEKNYRLRILPYLAEDVRQLCIDYLKYITHEIGYEPYWLFPGRNPDNHLSYSAVNDEFNRFWNATPYAGKNGKKPTAHSFRFTYVVNRMNDWMEHGVDLEVMLPYLSKQLGHKGIRETFYYYIMTNDVNRIIKQKDRFGRNVIPKLEV